jgi:hypothetical protein
MNEGVAGARAMNEGVGVVFPHLDLLWSRHCTVQPVSSACTWMHACFYVNSKGPWPSMKSKNQRRGLVVKEVKAWATRGGVCNPMSFTPSPSIVPDQALSPPLPNTSRFAGGSGPFCLEGGGKEPRAPAPCTRFSRISLKVFESDTTPCRFDQVSRKREGGKLRAAWIALRVLTSTCSCLRSCVWRNMSCARLS